MNWMTCILYIYVYCSCQGATQWQGSQTLSSQLLLLLCFCSLLSTMKKSCTIHSLLQILSPLRLAFCCHDSGATVLAMAPRNQLLITGGRKGWISILELPHKLQRQSFQAHDSPVKALAVDPTEDCFISGSSEGNIRVIMTHCRSVVFNACLWTWPMRKQSRLWDNMGTLARAHFL